MIVRALVLACAFAAVPAAAQSVRDALAQGDLICEFRDGFERSLLADLRALPGRHGLMLVYEGIGAGSVQVLSSAAAGRKPVVVQTTGKAVHLIEPVGPSVRVTTLTECLVSKRRRGAETCVRFTASHAWHFDTLVYSDPDAAFARLPAGISAGACEPWQLD